MYVLVKSASDKEASITYLADKRLPYSFTENLLEAKQFYTWLSAWIYPTGEKMNIIKI